jgi:hypothetical protein
MQPFLKHRTGSRSCRADCFAWSPLIMPIAVTAATKQKKKQVSRLVRPSPPWVLTATSASTAFFPPTAPLPALQSTSCASHWALVSPRVAKSSEIPVAQLPTSNIPRSPTVRGPLFPPARQKVLRVQLSSSSGFAAAVNGRSLHLTRHGLPVALVRLSVVRLYFGCGAPPRCRRMRGRTSGPVC